MDRESLLQKLLVGYVAASKKAELEQNTIIADQNLIKDLREKQQNKNLLGSFFIGTSVAIILPVILFMSSSGSGWLKKFIDFYNISSFQSFTTSLFAIGVFALLILLIYQILDKVYSDDRLHVIYREDPDYQKNIRLVGAAQQAFIRFQKSAQFQEDISFLPINYCQPSTIAFLYHLVESNRADSLQEAMDLYDDMHKMITEDMENDAHKACHIAANAAKKTEEASAENSELSSNHADFYTALSFYNIQ